MSNKHLINKVLRHPRLRINDRRPLSVDVRHGALQGRVAIEVTYQEQGSHFLAGGTNEKKALKAVLRNLNGKSRSCECHCCL